MGLEGDGLTLLFQFMTSGYESVALLVQISQYLLRFFDFGLFHG